MNDPIPPGVAPGSAAATVRARPRAATGRLLGLGFGAALRLAWVVPFQAGTIWLGRAVAYAPVVIAFGIARDALARGVDPLAAVARAATEPGVLLPTAGVAITLGLLAVATQAALWAGLGGPLAGAARNHGRPPLGTIPAALATAFPRFLALGAAVAVGAAVWFGATFSVLLAAARLYLDAAEEGQGGVPAAAALALAGALYLVGTPLLGLIARLAAARLATGTRSALAALHEACGLLLRRPFPLAGGVLPIRFTAWIAAATLAGPVAFLPPAPFPLLVVRLAVEGLADLAIAFALLAEFSFLVATAVDDREGLPPPAPRPARLPASPPQPEPRFRA